MQFAILAVGKLRDRHLAALCGDFEKRLRRYARVRIIEVRDSRRADSAAARAQEAEALWGQVPPTSQLVALHRGGEALSSVELAEWLMAEATAGRSKVAFAIGGPAGLAEEFLARAHLSLSLSRMTFTHEMARLLLVEQLYRAMTIWRGEPYHRGS